MPAFPTDRDTSSRVDMAEPDSDDGEGAFGSAPTTSSEKRRAQNAFFDNWLMDPATQVLLRQKARQKDRQRVAADEHSIPSLLAQQQSNGTPIINNPRDYQLELFERAKTENTIAVLETGSGKTLIAVLLIRWIIDNELTRRELGYPHRVTFFLVVSVPLVYQQYTVLDCNLDHNVIRLSGSDGVDRWNIIRWSATLKENKVIVCTADILLMALARGYINMRQINLIVFDEVHHTKKNHPYARIIKDFYRVESESANRPRIFGMTASPIDAKTDVVQASTELQSLLDSRIATTSSETFLEAVKPSLEEVLRYPQLPQAGFETPLLEDLKARFGDISLFSKTFTRASEIARHLGRWPADNYLLEKLSAEKQGFYELKLEKKHHARPGGRKVAELDEEVKILRDAVEYAEQQRGAISSLIHHNDMSSKVNQLRDYLANQYESSSDNRCIVFVDRRDTARQLHEIFLQLKIVHMHPGYLVGCNGNDAEDTALSYRNQILTLHEFRKGEVNCLFATSVAEEGLDIPKCNQVIRFDMCKTMIQYVQSRGRARDKSSKFVTMVETNNTIHIRLLQEILHQETAMRGFCKSLDPNQLLNGSYDGAEQLTEEERNLRTFVEPSTGAKLTYGNALNVLACFVSAIPTDTNEPQHPTYLVTNQGKKFISEVILPVNSPISSAEGLRRSKKTLAKRSAAFEACLELRMKNFLDEHLMPAYKKKLPAMRNAHLAVSAKATNQYPMKTKPDIWAIGRGTLPEELWAIAVDFPQGLDRPHRPLLFLTRSEMPDLPQFPIYMNDGRATAVKLTRLQDKIRTDDKMLEKLTEFTLRVFKDVFSKVYQTDAAQVSYWLAPAIASPSDRVNISGSQLDVDLLNKVNRSEEYKWTAKSPDDMLLNKFLVDKWDGARKFYSKSINAYLRQTDPVPPDSAKAKWNSSILDFSVSLYKNARAKAKWTENQPVMETEQILARRNMLAPPDRKEVTPRTRACLVPEPLRISMLPPEIATSCFVWPAIIHRIESYLISIEATTLAGVNCGPAFALAAFTKDSDNSGEHDEEAINFRQGMGENYERLEFIGDTFLKTATTISTFVLNPNENEFEFHVRRMLMLCNDNLCKTGQSLELFKYIRTMAFSRRLWYPEGLVLLQGKGVTSGKKAQYHQDCRHPLSDKTIADVCEALIGAAYLANNKPGAWHSSQWDNAVAVVTKLVNSPDHTMMKWTDYETTYIKPDYQIADADARERELAKKVASKHNYHFTYPRLLHSAFVHPSCATLHECVPNYQRLEFLGDALLDMAFVSYLFYAFPTKDPQWLTEHKMAMVSNRFLGALCVTIGFNKHLRQEHDIIFNQVNEYVGKLQKARDDAGDNCRDFWTSAPDPPKCLPDIVEAYVGAMFVDSGFNYSEVERFFREHIQWFFEDMSIYDTFANHHPCTKLHNLIQTHFGCMDHRLMAKAVPRGGLARRDKRNDGQGEENGNRGIEGDNDDEALVMDREEIVAAVMVHGQIVAFSTGTSGRNARLRAAQEALKQLDGLTPVDFRKTFGCDCREEENGTSSTRGADGEGMGVDCGI